MALSNFYRDVRHQLYYFNLLPYHNECLYCGSPCGVGRDHFLPLIWAIGTVVNFSSEYNKFPTVPCCHNCNTIAGNKMHSTIKDRRAYVQGRLKAIHRRRLVARGWDADELRALGPTLRGYVATHQLAKDVMWDRVRWVNPACVVDENKAWVDPDLVGLVKRGRIKIPLLDSVGLCLPPSSF